MRVIGVKSFDHSTDNLLAAIGLLVAVPAIYFFTGSFLKYEMNLLTDVDIYVPSPVVMIGGLLISNSLNLYSIAIKRSQGARTVSNSIKSRPINAVVFFIGVIFLIALLGYVIMENLTEV